ncbi:hypothetical protein JCM33774_53510 [Actinophytocola sp. KF-1]
MCWNGVMNVASFAFGSAAAWLAESFPVFGAHAIRKLLPAAVVTAKRPLLRRKERRSMLPDSRFLVGPQRT